MRGALFMSYNDNGHLKFEGAEVQEIASWVKDRGEGGDDPEVSLSVLYIAVKKLKRNLTRACFVQPMVRH